ncbi:pyridoxamine 5'-phosphate oxidase family protein [Rhizorhabdus dicambivorans]|uniref:General stress protein n=1 Tax=Rhizorhabdus dicambivorans TaxID=1850238 RepID=A0A2A4G0B9_9SPHN|nr:pyridoxamine 5'-phosphate oxidase family protein [Rhizorhabdus dicambivorans]ATE63032.1 general stress protein [Rhizorhabdus dicambivorans]PCE43209.1 general stress protein [Rhizorhabdus dicambivorans]
MPVDTHALKQHMWDKLTQSPFMMVGLHEPHMHSAPLTAQLDKDQVDTIWFFVARDNRLTSGGPAMAQFMSKGHDYFACLSGTISVSNDRAMIDKLWSRAVEAWFPGGKDDPDLTLIRFDIDDAELWEADMSLTGKLKLLFGGRIRADEEGSHARVSDTIV